MAFDPDALRDRYRREREKRLRPDGNDQYIEVSGPYARFTQDRFAAEADRVERPPITDTMDVLVVGGGFGGLLVGARLEEAGIHDVWIVDKAGDFGGTWYWNRYPGAQCDVDAYVYLPLLEELGTMPSEKYARAPEIQAHSQAIGRHYDLYRQALFLTEVTECRWHDASSRWVVKTNRGDELRPRFVCMATGPMHRPKLPAIPGIETFGGHSFHTSRWDYGYTGGHSDGELSGLRDQRVAVVGTGASAVQCVPHVAEAADHLYVFQRTPSSIDVRNDRPTDPEWVANLEPGWQQRRMDNFNNLFSGVYEPVDLVGDGWTDLLRGMLDIVDRGDVDLSPEGVTKLVEMADFEKMEQLRARVDALVDDPATAEALKPYYRLFCKRPCFHDEYLQSFNRPNVTLVDTKGRGVDHITERGLVVGETEFDVDCIIFATGFEVGTDFARRSGFHTFGRNGVSMTDKWADGPSTFHGIHNHGFPNCFVFRSVQAAYTVNYPHLLNEQSKHVAYILEHAFARGITVIEASREAEEAWVRDVVEASASADRSFLESCTPGYFNNEGGPLDDITGNSFYGSGSVAYFEVLAEWRANGKLEGLELTHLAAPTVDAAP